MTENKKQDDQVDEIDPLETGTNLPVAADHSEGENLPVSREDSAPLERSDFITPKLHLVQKTGDLSVLFPLGTWVLNKEIQLTKAMGDPLRVVILGTPHKFFMEQRTYDPTNTVPARTFTSVEDLEAEGLTLDWDNATNTRPTATRVARVTLLILKPAGLETENGFGMNIEGIGPCTLASWLLVNTAYTMAAKRIFTAIKLDLAGKPVHSLIWTLKSVPLKVSGYNIVAPQIAPETTLSDAAQAAIKATFDLQ